MNSGKKSAVDSEIAAPATPLNEVGMRICAFTIVSSHKNGANLIKYDACISTLNERLGPTGRGTRE